MDNNKKVAAQEVPIQEQQLININKTRKEHGLKHIDDGNKDFTPTK